MTWFRVDDGFSDHPKVLRLKAGKHWKGALALWTLAGSWSSKHEKDGFVPDHVVRHLGGTKQEADALVVSELWEMVDGGFAFHDWTKCNPSRTELENKRDQTRKRVENWRKERVGNTPTSSVSNALHAERVTPPPSRPVPSLPVPSLPERERPSAHESLIDLAEGMVRREFAKRFEAAEGSMWTRHGDPGVATLAAWLCSVPGDAPTNLARLLDAYFADPWARSQHFDVRHLARYPQKYFEPRKAPTSAAVAKVDRGERIAELNSALSELEGDLQNARVGNDLERASELIERKDELIAELRKLKGAAA